MDTRTDSQEFQMIICEKAKTLCREFKDKKDSESTGSLSSCGWFGRFKNRQNLYNVKLNGEVVNADIEEARKFIPEMQNFIEVGSYLSRQVFKVDENAFVLETNAIMN